MSKHSQLRSAPAVPAASLAERAKDALALERYKDAIEFLKQLIKQDPRPEWRNLLADAYAGRARTLASKAMFKEAEIVLGNTAAPDGWVREPLLYLNCLIRQGQIQKAAAFSCQHAQTGKITAAGSPQLADLAAALSLTVPVRLEAPLQHNSEPAQWRELTYAAQPALAAWIEGRSGKEIEPLLSKIPLRSQFKPLRLILKALLTAPENPERARQLLDGIPADSAFVSFRTAVEAAILEETEGKRPSRTPRQMGPVHRPPTYLCGGGERPVRHGVQNSCAVGRGRTQGPIRSV